MFKNLAPSFVSYRTLLKNIYVSSKSVAGEPELASYDNLPSTTSRILHFYISEDDGHRKN